MRRLTLAHLDLPAVCNELRAHGWRTGRAEPFLRRLYSGEVPDPLRFGEPVVAWAMSLPRAPLRIVHTRVAADGTRKLLLEALDAPIDGPATPAGTIEAVLMPTDRPGEWAGCLSSQIGCAMGCDFCASTLDGLVRNLTAAEIVGQFLLLRDLARTLGGRLANIVFMGMGEPMHNLPAVLPAIHRIADPTCGNLGYKNVQVSTVGIVPGIERLAGSGMKVQLALSLHAPTDDLRSRIVPAGRKYTVGATLDAAWACQQATGRVSNVEYCLLAGINDDPGHARQLAEAMARRRMHVNVIPYNAIGTGLSGATYARPSDAAIAAFLVALREAGVVAHVRKTRGADESAACGQLRRRSLQLATAP